MAWFRRMGVDQVAYHEATVLGREDDHPGQALDCYGSRGETPLRWGGAGAARLGLEGEVTPEGYRLAFGPGGFRDPLTGQQLVRTTRPGFELVVAAHKSLSLLGVVGRADDMHAILDTETSGTLAYLDGWAQTRGGRRGRAAVAAPTSGLVYAMTRHGTSRLGDPHLHDHVVNRLLASELVVPLIGITGAGDQPYTAIAVLATEHTIAGTLERLTTRPGPVVASELVEQAIRAKQSEAGYALSAGQRGAVTRICGSGRAIDVIVGVAGSGKTTALDIAARALEAAGYQVLGTTSGQAARTLGHHARVPSRTTRSLLWRLDHQQLLLDQRTVVVVDEASLTPDRDLARLLLGVERAGSKLVIVGDHRQLAPVGPGGALQALVERHPDIVTVLNHNLRQRDPAERAALDHLRSGDVQAAVGFYAANGRIHVAPSRTDALVAMVDAWATDTAAGHDTLMLAWRRASVADLNRLARVRAEQLDWLSGPDLETPHGRGYAVGDLVVTLAPNYEGKLVTSQHGRVAAINQRAGTVTMATDDGRRIILRGEALDADHLDYAYALTVHREEGATAERTHNLAEGGGRELAYVAMSRARGPSIIHAVADDLDQAIEDITHDWSLDRNQQWITRTATAVGIDPAIQTLSDDPEARRSRLLAELDTLERHAPPDITAELAAASADLNRLQRSRDNLARGTGRWHDTPAGYAARRLDQARNQRRHAQHQIDLPRIRRRERHRWRRVAQSAARTEAEAVRQWGAHGLPPLERLDRRITRAERRVAELETDARFRQLWLAQHPQLARRIQHTRRELRRLDDSIGVELEEQLEAMASYRAHGAGRRTARRGPDPSAPGPTPTQPARRASGTIALTSGTTARSTSGCRRAGGTLHSRTPASALGE